LATGSCNWRPRGWEMKDYIHLARRHFFTFGDWLHIGVRKGKGQDPVRRDEKTKSVVKSVVKRPANQPPIQPTKPTNQSKKQKLGPGWGAKNLLKRRQVRKPFFLGPNLSFVRPGVPLRTDGLWTTSWYVRTYVLVIYSAQWLAMAQP
jgi:hypothetical protein